MAISVLEFEKALKSLETALNLYDQNLLGNTDLKDALRDAVIQRFEYCLELSWKTSLKALGSNLAAAKPAIREMARNNLIQDSVKWLEFVDARNETSHSYDEKVAQKVYQAAKEFLPNGQQLLSKIKQ